MTLSKYHAGTKHTRTIHRGGAKPEATTAPYHAGSGAAKTTHAAPTLPQVNDKNYGGHRVGKRK